MHFSDIYKRCGFVFFFVNLAAASPWLRRSWSPNYSVLVHFVVLKMSFSLLVRSSSPPALVIRSPF
jgi:hypothetical protein